MIFQSDLDPKGLLYAVCGMEFFPRASHFSEEGLIVRFGLVQGSYMYAQVQRQVLLELPISLTQRPYAFFTTAIRALADLECYLETKVRGTPEKRWKNSKAEILTRMEESGHGYRFVPEKRSVFIKSRTEAENRAKEFIQSNDVFTFSNELLCHYTLKRLEHYLSEREVQSPAVQSSVGQARMKLTKRRRGEQGGKRVRIIYIPMGGQNRWKRK